MKNIISSTKAPAAIGPYSQAIEANGFIYVSGQLPLDPSTGALVEGGIEAQTARSLENIKSILEEAGSSMDKVVKTMVLLADMSLFASMNEVYARYFQENCPARCAFAVKQLPKDALVEIECVAIK